MDQANQDDSSDLLGLKAGPLEVLTEILANTEQPGAEASDDDLDAWWGTVEIDRVSSGLTLIAVDCLAEENHSARPSGPWIQKTDAHGDEPTQLTAAGRTALRQLLSA